MRARLDLFETAVAGLRVRTCFASGIAADSFPVDGELQLLFDAEAEGAKSGTWHPVDDKGAGTLSIRQDGRLAAISGGRRFEPDDLDAQIRRTVPFAAALQEKLTLHASAIRTEGKAIAFTGASGSGKSTLAGALEAEGSIILCDDLLPCRESADRIGVPSRQGDPWAFAAICALRRHDDPEPARMCRLSPVEGLRRLAEHGFGELPRAWSFLFDAYHRLASKITIFDLSIPNDLDRLGSSARWLHDEVFPHLGAETRGSRP